MAFKREGTDASWLKSLQKRRVSELFAEDIPEDEAHLMKNGRFACMVCNSRPVFDTVAMLASHRAGKKHAAQMEIKLAQDEEMRQLRRKRQHKEITGNKEISTHGETESSCKSNTALLGHQPYDPRVKKQPRQMQNPDPSSSDDAGSSQERFRHHLNTPAFRQPMTAHMKMEAAREREEQMLAHIKPYRKKQRSATATDTAKCDPVTQPIEQEGEQEQPKPEYILEF